MKLPPNILTFDKDKEDYDYDVQPTLPPSLPNLKIIPFLPSDALDAKKKMDDKKRYPILDERVTDANIYTFTNLFSPPIETEGGFVPKEPPLLDNFYDTYHTTGIEANAVTAITVSPITKQNEPKEDSCLSEGLKIRHGEAVTSKNVCVVCVCYYGDIVCQDPQCPPLQKGCRQTTILDRTTCCPRIICSEEDSNLVLDHLEITSNPKDVITVADGIVSQDPFKNVIRTEPAPNLQTLIGDLPDYIRRNSPTTTDPTLSINQESTTRKSWSSPKPDELSLDKVLQLLLINDEEKTTITYPNITGTSTEVNNRNTTKENADNITENVIKDNGGGVGPLKLAGCNIYGRMYRVGRIISELSGPCLECKCTEIGVQCTKLC
ncbi:hypothetical protein QE152_g11101 [Popillia japonica]|uniref:VWFC domain-containing protein n=1 Tax=Popillia japonica TaxID=7064 RepID=A0AAW1LT55_POPJA